MKREPARQAPERPPETEAWKIIFSAFALSGSLVIGWTLFVLLAEPGPRPTRLVDTPVGTDGGGQAPPAKP